MSDPRTKYPAGIGRQQIVEGIPTGRDCVRCGLPIERGQVTIRRREGPHHGPCSAAKHKEAAAQ